MHHLSAKERVVDATTKISKDVGWRGNDAPLCPKPRRRRSALPAQFLNYPPLCTHHQDINSDGRTGILNIISDKKMDEGKELCGCSSCFSPPGRTHNPVIHDDHFLKIHIWPQFTPTNA